MVKNLLVTIIIFLILFIILYYLNIKSKILQLRKETFLEYGIPKYRDKTFNIKPSPACGPCRRCPPSAPPKICEKIDMELYMPEKDKTICPKLVLSEWMKKNRYNEIKVRTKLLKDNINSNNIHISNVNEAQVKAITYFQDIKKTNSSINAEEKVNLAKIELEIAENQLKSAKNEYDTFIKTGSSLVNVGGKCFTETDYAKILNKLKKKYNEAKGELFNAKQALDNILKYINKLKQDEEQKEKERLEREKKEKERLEKERKAEEERKKKEKERLEKERKAEEERKRKEKERLERERKAKEERDKKTKWMREVTHHFYVPEGITDTPSSLNSRFITNQSSKASSNNHSLTYRTGTIRASPNKVNGKNLYYINQPCKSWDTGTMLSFGNSTQVSTYHIMFLITRDASKKVNWRDDPNNRAEFVYTQAYANVSNGRFTNLESGKYLKYGGLLLGRYPNRSAEYMEKSKVYGGATKDFTGYHLSMYSAYYKSKPGRPSQQNWWGGGFSTTYSNGKLGIPYGYSHLSCICMKLDKHAPPNESAGHVKVYSHGGNGVNDLVESPKMEWVKRMHLVINSFALGRYIGGYVAGMWVPSCPDNVQIYEVVVKKDGVLSDIDEKLCAESLLKKWLPYLGNR